MVVVAEFPHLKIYIPQPIGAAAGFSAEPESLVFVYISTGCVVPTWRHQCLTHKQYFASLPLLTRMGRQRQILSGRQISRPAAEKMSRPSEAAGAAHSRHIKPLPDDFTSAESPDIFHWRMGRECSNYNL